MKPVTITGATGLLGNHLASALLREGIPVIAFVRRKSSSSGSERMEKRFKWLGLDQEDYAWLARHTGEIIHCAANTSFSEKLRPWHLKALNVRKWITRSLKRPCSMPLKPIGADRLCWNDPIAVFQRMRSHPADPVS